MYYLHLGFISAAILLLFRDPLFLTIRQLNDKVVRRPTFITWTTERYVKFPAEDSLRPKPRMHVGNHHFHET